MANFAVTLPKTRFTPLTLPERTNGYTHKFTVLGSDLAVAAATGSTDTITVTLGASSPTRWIVPQALGLVTSPITGTLGAFTVTVGTSGSPTVFLPSTTVLSGSVIQPTTGPNTVATPGSAFGVAGMTPTAVFTCATSGSPSTITGGQVDFYLTILDQTQLG